MTPLPFEGPPATRNVLDSFCLHVVTLDGLWWRP